MGGPTRTRERGDPQRSGSQHAHQPIEPDNTAAAPTDTPEIAVTFQVYEARYRELFREQSPTAADVRNAYMTYLFTRQAPQH
jgi:hypothetical protein